jgi:molybdopterin synthase catalytic subunit
MTPPSTPTATEGSARSDARDVVEVVYDELSHERAVELVTHESAGAISTFIGTTRDNFNGKRPLQYQVITGMLMDIASPGKKVVRLEYEGYVPMAKLELLKICAQIREQWPSVVGIVMFHRLGVVEVKQASVIIAVSSPHRREAIEACAYAIDTLKATVPIWKSEQYEGDSRVWKENLEWENGAAVRHSCCGPKRVMAPATT